MIGSRTSSRSRPDALDDAEIIREYAANLQAASELYRDESTIDEVRHHYRRVREWHLAEAERRVS